MAVRTRVAPSPTGDPHLGTAYIALFNLAFARKHEGEFVLRIEDTDQERSTSTSEQAIKDALRWLGLTWDEGPDVGGGFGPYRSSERTSIYRTQVAKLLISGGAFHCFCSAERLEVLRKQQQQEGHTSKYDGHCLSLSRDVVETRIERGDPHVIRLVVPEKGECIVRDEIRGDVVIPWSQVDMQILLKSDGFPTYHLAVVVDDHLMGITHVFRGEEWISSYPKHQLLYQYFNWQQPQHFHLPLLRNPDHSKMSKRRHPTSVNFYRRMGYLPESLVNYLAMLGWSMPDERELFSVPEMIAEFEPNRISTGSPVFDVDKLNWMNGQYIRRLSREEFVNRVANWVFDREHSLRLADMVQERTERFADLVGKVDYLLGELKEMSPDNFAHPSLDHAECKRVLDHVLRSMEALDAWKRDDLYQSVKQLSELMEIRFRDFLYPLFVALSGRSVALPLFDSMEYLGSDLVRARIRAGIKTLGGISKKLDKKLDKEWRQLHCRM